MKMSADDWEVGGTIEVTVKKGVKLKKHKVKYSGSFGEPVHAVWRVCPHGVCHPHDRPYHDTLDDMTKKQIRKIMCREGCFKIHIDL